MSSQQQPSARSRRGRAVLAGTAVAIAAVVGLVLTSTGDPAPPAASGISRGPAAPELEFVFFDGSTSTLAAYEGRPVVANFWASWCPACVQELSSAFRPVQERLGDEVAFVGFNVRDRREVALALVDETGVLFDLAEDPDGDVYAAFGGFGMPLTAFISADGEVVHLHNGPVTADQLEDLIRDKLTAASGA